MTDQAIEAILRYHEQTKHHFHRYAKSLGFMDWKNQPDPFRTYEGSPSLSLPLLDQDPPVSHADFYAGPNAPPGAFLMENIAAFLELSLGLSAWKAVSGSRWSLRINPSSGNLHPTECHLFLPSAPALEAGVYHYNPLMHSLEKRAGIPRELWEAVRLHFGCEGFLVALTSIFWRESWKYGERAFRYCNHDVGHALACLALSARLQGWKIKYLNALSHEDIERLLGFDRVRWQDQEDESPEVLCFVYGSGAGDVDRGLPPHIVSELSRLPFTGEPNTLSRERVRWEIIRQAALHSKKPATLQRRYEYGDRGCIGAGAPLPGASKIIRQRRSATAFSGGGFLDRDQFLAILDKTLPRDDCAPFDVELMGSSAHLLLFVHRVRDLEQGLYFFLRDDKDFHEIKGLCRSDLLWKTVREGFPLYLLKTGDFRRTAARVSCDQDIAGDGVFSLGMICRFRETIQEGPWRYRSLFWECGMIGQVLYLEAEAHGMRGTGIGCFFDDPVHDLMGLEDNAYQSLYHFTVGEPVEDPRLATQPPYGHLKRRVTGDASGASSETTGRQEP